MEIVKHDALYPLFDVPADNVYSTIGLLLFGGVVLGHFVKKLDLPSLSGNILAGILLGPIFGVIQTTQGKIADQLELFSQLALALIAINIGSYLKFNVIHNALRRIFVLSGVSIVLIPLLVTLGMWGVLQWIPIKGFSPFFMALLFGTFSLATAPATVVHVTEELKAKGIFVKTLIALVVLSNAANIAYFVAIREFCFKEPFGNISKVVIELLAATAMGVVSAGLLIYVRKRKFFGKTRVANYSFAIFAASYGFALYFKLSPLIVCMTLGIVVANFSRRNQILDSFKDFEEVIYTFFFALTGSHASFADFSMVWPLALCYLALRFFACHLAIHLTSQMMTLPKTIRRYMGMALVPQGGITIGLLLALDALDTAQPHANVLTPIILFCVTVSEIVGAFALKRSIYKSGEVDKALPRLIDFIEEEYITLNCKSTTQEGVIEELAQFLFLTHRIPQEYKESFIQAVIEQEEFGTSAIGKNIAIPHGEAKLPGNRMMGVMGIFKEGILWEGAIEPVHVVILLAYPEKEQTKGETHVGVVLAISQLFDLNTVFERGLQFAKNSADAYEKIADEKFENLNKLLET